MTNYIIGLKLKSCVHRDKYYISSEIKEIVVGCKTDKHLGFCKLFKENHPTEICSFSFSYTASKIGWRWGKDGCRHGSEMISESNDGSKCEIRVADVTAKGLN